MKIDRLMYLLMTLLSKRSCRAVEVATLFNVSTRTIYRDIDTLSLAGIPIHSRQGYEGGFFLDDSFKMEAFLLQPKDRILLYDLATHLNSLYPNAETDHLLELLTTKDTSPISLNLSPWSDYSFLIQQLEEAIEHHLLVTFRYTNYHSETTQRNVEPYHLFYQSHAWYLLAFCHLRQEERVFRLNRMREFKISTYRFSLGEISSVTALRPPNIMTELINKAPLIEVHLAFHPKVKARVYDLFKEEDTKESLSEIHIQTKLPDDDWLLGVLLSFGPNVRVLSPLSLQKEVIQEATKIIEQYDSL